MDNVKRVLLIGAGHYAETAHLPAIQRVHGIKLAGVVDLKSRMERVRKLQSKGLVPKNIRYYPVSDSCNGRGDLGPKNTAAAIRKLDSTLLPGIDAVIVSTYGCHYEYVQWALNNEKHVLVDKPLTNIPGMVVNPADARKLINHFDILTDLASKKNLLFSLVTQRRYSPTYIQMAKELKTAWDGLSDRSVNSIRSIQAFTSDGWFLPSRNYAWGTSGGKVKNTGYHLIDIVTWLLRQVANGIEDAVIQVSPLCVDHLARLGGQTASNPPLSEPSELYASAQITFREGKERLSCCVFQFHAQHENFAVTRATGREFGGTTPSDDFSQAYKNRTKEEELRISLGPYFRIYFRRVAKVLRRAGFNPGEDSNAYLEYSRSYQGAPWPQPFAFQTFPYEDPDSAPAEEFLKALRKPDPASVPTRSPVQDHAAAVRLFSGIYEGIAQARMGNFDPIFMPLKKWWTTPPAPKTPPTPQPSDAPRSRATRR